MQRAAVDVHHWLTGPEFLAFFAISRAAPGPGSLIVVLIGQKAAGLAGALVAFLGMFGAVLRRWRTSPRGSGIAPPTPPGASWWSVRWRRWRSA